MALTENDMTKLLDMAENKQYLKLKSELVEMNEYDIAEILSEMPPEKALVVFRLLPKDLSSDVFACLDIDEQQHIINSIEDKELNSIIEDLAIDDAVDMVEELPASMVKRILKNATPETRKQINQFLQYPDNSAGSIMTNEYVALRPQMSVREAFDYIRAHGVDKETIYTCYVITPSRELLGVVTLKDMMMSAYDVRIQDIMDDNVITATTTEDQEEVAADFNKYDLLAMPVNERSVAGLFLAMQYPQEIPGVTNNDFLRAAINARRDTPVPLFTFIKSMEKTIKDLQMKEDLAFRFLNEGFSGGEKKRNEIVQMEMLKPSLAMLDEIDSGLDVDAMHIVGDAVNKLRDETHMSLMIVSHYERFFDLIEPQFTHVLVDGKVVMEGDGDLARRVDREGYDWIYKELNIVPAAAAANDENVKRNNVGTLGSCAVRTAAEAGRKNA